MVEKEKWYDDPFDLKRLANTDELEDILHTVSSFVNETLFADGNERTVLEEIRDRLLDGTNSTPSPSTERGLSSEIFLKTEQQPRDAECPTTLLSTGNGLSSKLPLKIKQFRDIERKQFPSGISSPLLESAKTLSALDTELLSRLLAIIVEFCFYVMKYYFHYSTKKRTHSFHILKVLFSSDTRQYFQYVKTVLSVCEKNVSAFSCYSEVLQYQQIIQILFSL